MAVLRRQGNGRTGEPASAKEAHFAGSHFLKFKDGKKELELFVSFERSALLTTGAGGGGTAQLRRVLRHQVMAKVGGGRGLVGKALRGFQGYQIDR
jgi:hypothetical protein